MHQQKKVRDFIEPYNYISCPQDLSLSKALELAGANDGGINPIIIKDEDSMLGIFTETDLARLIIKGTQVHNLLIGDVMTQSPFFIESNATIQECAKLMAQNHIKYLPIKNQTGRVFAVIDIYMILKALIDQAS
jgi:signal-transduction protein with cAMP-binding, CBS, and nucleotidyltransferase domain